MISSYLFPSHDVRDHMEMFKAAMQPRPTTMTRAREKTTILTCLDMQHLFVQVAMAAIASIITQLLL
jgi:hypothetical protein